MSVKKKQMEEGEKEYMLQIQHICKEYNIKRKTEPLKEKRI